MCTIAKLKQGEKATIKPGESTEIEVEWKTKDAVGEFSKGVIDRHQRPEPSGDQAQRPRDGSSPGRDPAPASGRGHLDRQHHE